jgi:hypothetical protein
MKMTSEQFKKAADLALNHPEIELLNVDNSHLYGCALPDFEPVWCTIKEVAALIRWQCQYIFGDGYDAEELNSIADIGRRRFKIIDS